MFVLVFFNGTLNSSITPLPGNRKAFHLRDLLDRAGFRPVDRHEIVKEKSVEELNAQLVSLVGEDGAEMLISALYAASAVPQDSDIPWQRVINYKGGISQRSIGSGGLLQQKLLEAEGIEFNQNGRTNLEHFRWKGE